MESANFAKCLPLLAMNVFKTKLSNEDGLKSNKIFEVKIPIFRRVGFLRTGIR